MALGGWAGCIIFLHGRFSGTGVPPVAPNQKLTGGTPVPLRDEHGPIEAFAETGRVRIDEGKRAAEGAVRAEGGPARKVHRGVDAVASPRFTGKPELELFRKPLRLG